MSATVSEPMLTIHNHTFDRATREASLRGGDAGWDSAHPVRDGRVDGLILAPEEAAWLQACWSATQA